MAAQVRDQCGRLLLFGAVAPEGERRQMKEFWDIVAGWDKLGQFIFLLIVLGGIGTLIQKLAYYFIVAIRGWPPN